MSESTHAVYEVYEHQKMDLLVHLCRAIGEGGPTLILARSKETLHLVTTALTRAELPCEGIHGGKKPELRERALASFTEGELPILVAIESTVRELSFPKLAHVIYAEAFESAAAFRTFLECSTVASIVTQNDKGLLARLDEIADANAERVEAEGFTYDRNRKITQRRSDRNKTQSKPLQHKKPKLKNKGPRRKTGRTRKR